MQDAPKAVWSVPYVSVAFLPSLKQNFIAYRSSKVLKYSLADNMGQGKNPTMLLQSDAPEESYLWTAWQLFSLEDDQTCHSKDGGSAYSVGQLWDEIAGA